MSIYLDDNPDILACQRVGKQDNIIPAPKFSPIAKFRIFLLVHYRLTLTFAAK
jgi:hypothetical protein